MSVCGWVNRGCETATAKYYRRDAKGAEDAKRQRSERFNTEDTEKGGGHGGGEIL